MRAALALCAVLLAACGGSTTTPVDAGPFRFTGTDEALVAQCIACHAAEGAAWSLGSSHAMLLDCAGCHAAVSEKPGAGHRSRPTCDTCHSETAHRALACTTCHDVHGSANLDLVRPALNGQPVTFTAPQGQTDAGLAHGDGSGACEVCHDTTTYARKDGKGAPHHTGSCAECHAHARGFAPP